MTTERTRLAATTYDEVALRTLLSRLTDGRKDENQDARFSQLHREIKARDDHFLNASNVGPKFRAPFDRSPVFQSDVIRRVHQQAKSRLTEHPPVFRVVPPKNTQAMRDVASSVEGYFQAGYRQAEERLGYDILGALADGQLLHCYGVLHWRKWYENKPEPPDADEMDEAPEDRERYRETDDGTYVEREESRLQRYREMKAESGWCWWLEVPRADEFAFVDDKSRKRGMAVAVLVRSVGILDYTEALRNTDKIYLSLNEQDKKIEVYEESSRPESYDPSWSERPWGELRVALVEFRNECYELASEGDKDWTLIKSWKKQRASMPRFALATASEFNHPDPLYRWQPWFLGLFRTKPSFDYERSLQRILVEQAAIPRYWIKLRDGEYMLDDTGQRAILSDTSALADVLPNGATLEKVQIDVNPAFIAAVESGRGELMEAIPETGTVDAGATTQPHTLNMLQTQANAGIASLKRNAADCLRVTFQDILDEMAADEDDTYEFYDDARNLITIEPAKLKGMKVEVMIEPNSGAQQIAVAEYHRSKLSDPNTRYTVREYLENTGYEDPDEQIADFYAETAEIMATNLIMQEELIKAFGDQYVLSPGGNVVNGLGQAVDVWAVLESRGFQRPQAPQPAPMGPQGAPQQSGMNAPAPLDATMQPMGGLDQQMPAATGGVL